MSILRSLIVLVVATHAWASSTGGAGHSGTKMSPAYPYLVATYYLDAVNGKDTNGCASPSDACATIHKIEMLSSPSGVVLMQSGIYTNTQEQLMHSGLTYAASPSGTPIITGAASLSGWAYSSGTGDCVTGTGGTNPYTKLLVSAYKQSKQL